MVAVQGSNSIEGYNASLDDVAAAVEGEPTLDATTETQLALAGYRDAMTYVLQVAEDPDAGVDEGVIKALHFMMLKHDLAKSPGRWRPGYIGVREEASGRIVYEAPDAEIVPDLITSMLLLLEEDDAPALVRAAMAHLNLVMIHPFRDGNGRRRGAFKRWSSLASASSPRCSRASRNTSAGTRRPTTTSLPRSVKDRGIPQMTRGLGSGSCSPLITARPRPISGGSKRSNGCIRRAWNSPLNTTCQIAARPACPRSLSVFGCAVTFTSRLSRRRRARRSRNSPPPATYRPWSGRVCSLPEARHAAVNT